MATGSDGYFWFLNSLTTIRVPAQSGADQLSVVEQRAPKDFSPPLHLQRTQDEMIYILEGDFRIRMGEQEQRCKAGDILLIPKGTPHSFLIESPEGGRWLTFTVGVDYENFVRALARPADSFEVPPSGEETSPENVLALTMTAAQFGFEVVGPSLR